MIRNQIGAPNAPRASGGYAQAVECVGAARLLFISGQIPMARDGQVPHGFAAQCRLVWANIAAQLRAASMTLEDVVKVTTYLSGREYAEENGRIRREILGNHAPALTVIIAEIYDPAWLLEIEAVAAA